MSTQTCSAWEELKSLGAVKIKQKVVFCSRHKKQPWILLWSLIGAAGILFGLYRDAIEPYFSDDKAIISLYPDSIKPDLDTWKEYHSFTVINNADYPVYAIWIQCEINKERSTNEQIKIDFVLKGPKGESFVLPTKKEAPPDSIILLGKSARKLDAFFLIIRSLGPKSSVEYSLQISSRSKINQKEIELECLLNILSYSKKPDRFKFQEKNVNVFFDKMPKGLTVNSLDKYYMFIESDKTK